MAQQPLTMEQLKQILQLNKDGVSIREIARRLGISRNSVRKYLDKCKASNELDKDAEPQSSKELAEQAYNNDELEHGTQRLQQLIQYFKSAQSELVKTGVTRLLLWQEYLLQHSDGYGYSQYCYHLADWQKKSDLAMHLEYTPADMIMVDFAGKRQQYTDIETGEVIECQVFVAILPFSGLIYCHAVTTQKTADFADCINTMLKFYGGVPFTILCDNLKTAVTSPCRYEPGFTDLCHQLAEHYQTTFSATRPYSPRDKAMVERAVNIVYTNIYAPLRNQTFTSLMMLNEAIKDRLLLLNNKPYKNTPYSRWYFYDQQECSKLRALPTEPFRLKKVVSLTVQRNYHVQLSENHCYYSVPYQYVGKKVKVYYDKRTVEVYADYERIALHILHPHQKAYTTLGEHMPAHHQHMQLIKGWNKDDLLAQAGRVGPSALQAATLMLDNSIYIEQNYKACFGMLMLQKKYGILRLEAACSRTLQGTRVNYTMIKNILEKGLDKLVPPPENNNTIPEHDNIRGKDQYQ